MGWYDVMQVCTNGHVITDRANSAPEFREDYCSKCGTKTTTECAHCRTPIRGDYHVEGVIAFGGLSSAPAFCHKCGQPYPWTEASLKAAQELIDMADASEEEKTSIKEDLASLVADTPRTAVAAAKMKRFLGKAAKEIGTGLRSILVDVASEAAKKALFPGT